MKVVAHNHSYYNSGY